MQQNLCIFWTLAMFQNEISGEIISKHNPER